MILNWLFPASICFSTFPDNDFPLGCNTSCWRNKYTASSLLIPSAVSHSPTIYAGVFNSSLNFTFCCSLANTVTPGNDSPEKVSDAASTTGIAFFLKPRSEEHTSELQSRGHL